MTISLESLAYIIEKAREFDVEVAPAGDESKTGDDEEIDDILEATRSNPTYQELVGALRSLNDDERDEIIAMTWIGRGDFSKDEWDAALTEARNRHNGREVRYLVGTPLLADYLEEAAAQLGYSLEEFETGRM
ncbi:DUF3775 domain-containing protein [Dongia sp.]|uniref:DUF3775 domain-containing protein n=1 Tax=Dongia sp. TaxID=1977262 RepID=UPI0035B3D18E